MGLKPMSMAPLTRYVVGGKFPGFPANVVVMEVRTPPMPWLLNWGWPIIAAAIIMACILVKYLA